MWGLILRTAGNYAAAKHKFDQALKLEPENETALFEMDLLNKIMELDDQISIDMVQSLKNMRAIENGEDIRNPNKKGVCSVMIGAVCNIF